MPGPESLPVCETPELLPTPGGCDNQMQGKELPARSLRSSRGPEGHTCLHTCDPGSVWVTDTTVNDNKSLLYCRSLCRTQFPHLQNGFVRNKAAAGGREDLSVSPSSSPSAEVIGQEGDGIRQGISRAGALRGRFYLFQEMLEKGAKGVWKADSEAQSQACLPSVCRLGFERDLIDSLGKLPDQLEAPTVGTRCWDSGLTCV